ncbi:GNAT family N-acetyltransferase [Bacillus spongiae]|uniref:GNAT family N-acetyltransferase n=1 Tax=Bacillus spongiae TaxID=2683610 RepID=A0ABU8H9Q0_9BACI
MIKKLEQEDFQEVLKLSMYAFQYIVPKEKWEERFKDFLSHEIYGIRVENRLASKLHLLPLKIWLHGREVNMGGIAGVATYPEYRRKGYVDESLRFILNRMREKGQYISLLHPFSIPFYRKFGWELFSSYNKVTVDQTNMKPFSNVSGEVRRLTKNESEELMGIYDLYSQQFNGMLIRTKDWWLNRTIGESIVAIYYSKEKVPTGYVLYDIKDKRLEVNEMIVLNNEARKGLWNFLCQHDSMVENIELMLNDQDPLPFLLHNPKVKTELHPYFMARVVDVQKCLESLRLPVKEEENIFLHITDSHAPWNNKTFLLSKNEINVFQKEIDSPSCQSQPKRGVSMNINALSALLFGVKSARELADMDYLTGKDDEITRLNEVFSGNQPYFVDFF